MDRNTILSLQKKGHSNSSIARSYIFAVIETVCKVVKKFN